MMTAMAMNHCATRSCCCETHAPPCPGTTCPRLPKDSLLEKTLMHPYLRHPCPLHPYPSCPCPRHPLMGLHLPRLCHMRPSCLRSPRSNPKTPHPNTPHSRQPHSRKPHLCVCNLGHLSGRQLNGIMVLSRTCQTASPLASFIIMLPRFTKWAHTGVLPTVPTQLPTPCPSSTLQFCFYGQRRPLGGRRPIPVPHLGVPIVQWTKSSGDSPASSPSIPFPRNMDSSLPPSRGGKACNSPSLGLESPTNQSGAPSFGSSGGPVRPPPG